MKGRGKDFIDIGIQVESKEGERGSLSRNKANVRSPSLGFNPNTEMDEDMALDYLADILVEAYLHEQRNRTEKA